MRALYNEKRSSRRGGTDATPVSATAPVEDDAREFASRTVELVEVVAPPAAGVLAVGELFEACETGAVNETTLLFGRGARTPSEGR